MNESQPVCPACGAPPRCRGDDPAFSALLDESSAITAASHSQEPGRDALDVDQALDPIRGPVDFEEAADEADALLEATGFATFCLPEGFRLFRFPTTHVM
jgi:hypothetical protein